jgi:hypothetical protein
VLAAVNFCARVPARGCWRGAHHWRLTVAAEAARVVGTHRVGPAKSRGAEALVDIDAESSLGLEALATDTSVAIDALRVVGAVKV